MNRGRLGAILVVFGSSVAAYAATIVLWRDPATDLYAPGSSTGSAQALDQAFAEQDRSSPALPAEPARARSPSRRSAAGAAVEAEELAVARAANELHAQLKLGKALGQLKVPRLGLKTVFVHGTRWRA